MGEFMGAYSKAMAADNPMLQTVLRAYLQTILQQQQERAYEKRSKEITPYQREMLSLQKRTLTEQERRAKSEEALKGKLTDVEKKYKETMMAIAAKKEERLSKEQKELTKFRNDKLKQIENANKKQMDYLNKKLESESLSRDQRLKIEKKLADSKIINDNLKALSTGQRQITYDKLVDMQVKVGLERLKLSKKNQENEKNKWNKSYKLQKEEVQARISNMKASIKLAQEKLKSANVNSKEARKLRKYISDMRNATETAKIELGKGNLEESKRQFEKSLEFKKNVFKSETMQKMESYKLQKKDIESRIQERKASIKLARDKLKSIDFNSKEARDLKRKISEDQIEIQKDRNFLKRQEILWESDTKEKERQFQMKERAKQRQFQMKEGAKERQFQMELEGEKTRRLGIQKEAMQKENIKKAQAILKRNLAQDLKRQLFQQDKDIGDSLANVKKFLSNPNPAREENFKTALDFLMSGLKKRQQFATQLKELGQPYDPKLSSANIKMLQRAQNYFMQKTALETMQQSNKAISSQFGFMPSLIKSLPPTQFLGAITQALGYGNPARIAERNLQKELGNMPYPQLPNKELDNMPYPQLPNYVQQIQSLIDSSLPKNK